MEISQANSLARSLFFSISPAQEGGGGEERDPAKEDDSERVYSTRRTRHIQIQMLTPCHHVFKFWVILVIFPPRLRIKFIHYYS